MSNEELYIAETVSDYLRENAELLTEQEKAAIAAYRFHTICQKSEIGDYSCAVSTAHGYCCDTCLQAELHRLWDCGVITIGSCCGHGRLPAYIQVCPGQSVQKMHELGYEPRPIEGNGDGENCFIPKMYLPIFAKEAEP